MGVKIDMTGWVMKDHGIPTSRWTVIEEDKQYKLSHPTVHNVHWKCRCECGNYRTVSGSSLRNGQSLSCGCLKSERQIINPSVCSTANNDLMSIVLDAISNEDLKLKYPPQPIHPNAIDITGQRFGKLVALWKVGNQRLGHTSRPLYAFRCDCGKIKISTSDMARRGQLTTCGCGLQERGIAKRANYLNKKIGRLTVVEALASKGHRGMQWRCLCECGNECIKSSYDFTRGATSCGICIKYDLAREKLLLLNDERNKDLLYKPINTLVGLYVGKLYIYEDTGQSKSTYRLYKAKCECGSIIDYTLQCLQHGITMSCGCINSRGEEKIAQILNSNNIPFERQKMYIDCRSPKNHVMPYDFYINNNFLLEFDGIQHFYEADRFSQSLEERQYYDQLKNNYAKQHNIPLKRIPYWEYDNITLQDIMSDKWLIKESA